MTKLLERTPLTRSIHLPVYLASLSHFTLELCHNFMPVLYPLLTVQMGLNFTQIGILALANNLVTSTFQPLLGFLPGRYGAERVVAGSILWLGVLMGLVGFAPNFLSLVLLVALASLGSSAYHPAGVVNVTHQSSTRRGMAMSLFSVGGTLGAALSPTWILVWLGLLGTRSAIMVIPIAVAISLLFYQQAQCAQHTVAHTSTTRITGSGQAYRLGLVLLVLGTMARSWFQVALTTYLPAWVQSNGGSLAHGGQLLSLFLFATGAGSLLGGIVADRTGPWWVVLLTNVVLAPAFWLWLGAPTLVQILLLTIMGMALGANFSTGILLAQDVLPNRIALASALVMGLGWVPAGLGASFTGYLADRTSLTTAMYALLAPAVIAALCVLLFRVGWKPQKLV